MKKTFLCLVIPLVLVGGLFFLTCFQGLDLADEGFWFSNAHVLAVDPGKASYSFGYYLTVAISALWGQWVSDSFISYRFLAVISKLVIMVMSYIVLRKSIDSRSLFWGLILGGLFTYGGVMCFYGNTCTTLFYMASVVFAYQWIETGKRLYLFFFGLMLGIGAFARIANLTDVLFFLIIPFYHLVNREFKIRTVILDCITGILGWMTGVGCIVALMIFLGHWDAFVEMLGTYTHIAGEDESGHSLTQLIGCQLSYYWYVIYYSSIAAGILCVSIVMALLTRKFPVRIARSAVFASAITMSIALSRLFLLLCRFPVVFFFLVCFALACFFERRAKVLTLWAFAFLCLTVSSLGSDVAGTANKYCLPICLPLIISAISHNDVIENCLRKVLRFSSGETRSLRMVMYGLVVFLGIGILRQIWLDPIRDNADRCSLTTYAHIKGLEHIRTTPERAKAIETIVASIKEYAEPGQPLLVFHSASALHALTGMLPYVCSTWSFLLTPDLFNRDLVNAQKRFCQRKPLVVLPKYTVGCREWPQERKEICLGSSGTRFERQLAMKEFLAGEGYRTVFENDDFKILKIVRE